MINIDITYEKEIKNLNQSKYIQKLIKTLNVESFGRFNDDLRLYSAGDSALSFSKIMLSAERLQTSTTYLALTNNKSYSNLLNDFAALRKYDSTFNEPLNNMKIKGGKLLFINSDLIKDSETYIVGIKNDDFLEEHLEIKLGKLKFKMNKDLTKIPIEMKDFIKIIDIISCY